eukprot:119228-Lingulodinium_polyedra.AAC.1
MMPLLAPLSSATAGRASLSTQSNNSMHVSPTQWLGPGSSRHAPVPPQDSTGHSKQSATGQGTR